MNRLLHELNDPRQPNTIPQSAIVQAALHQILNSLHPYLRPRAASDDT